MKTYPLFLFVLCLLAAPNSKGGNWQVIPSGNGTDTVNELHGVSALAENDVWAVGVYSLPNPEYPSIVCR